MPPRIAGSTATNRRHTSVQKAAEERDPRIKLITPLSKWHMRSVCAFGKFAPVFDYAKEILTELEGADDEDLEHASDA